MPDAITLAGKPLTQTADPKFQIFSGALKAYEDGGSKRLSTTASSSVEDLHGDTMTPECVRDMAQQAKDKGMTIFLNHRYAVPEDVMGSTIDTRTVSRAHDDKGDAIYDFDLDFEVNEENPRALNTYAAIKGRDGRKGVKLGVSIGAMIEEWEFKDEKQGWWGGLIIKKVNLLEASVVGIPANPRSWVQNAVHALKGAYGISEPIEEPGDDAAGPLELKTGEATLPKHGVAVPEGASATLTVKADGSSEVVIHDKKDGDEAIDVQGQVTETQPNEIAACPDCGGGEDNPIDGCGNGYHGSVDPNADTNAAGDGAEEKAAPAGETTAAADETAKGAEAPTSPVDLEAAKATAETLADDTEDSPLVKALISTLIAGLEQAIGERDAARAKIVEQEALLAGAAEIIATIASTSLGRKTAFAGPVRDFQARFSGIYDREFLKMMERDT